MPERLTIQINDHDNVAVAVHDLPAGTKLEGGLVTRDPIPQAHKIALRDIPAGGEIVRYGVVLGYAKADIPAGSWINEHMLDLPESPALTDMPWGTRIKAAEELPAPTRTTWLGYRNKVGPAGTRNLLGIVTTVQCAAGVLKVAVERIKKELLPKYPHVDGVVAVTHPYGCGVAINAPLAYLPIRAVSNLIRHPNFGGEIMVVGLGCEKLTYDRVLPPEDITPENVLTLQDYAGHDAMMQAILDMADRKLQRLDRRRREELPISELLIGMQCGGSDAFSGITANPSAGYAADMLVRGGATVLFSEVTEVRDGVHMLAARCVSAGVRDKLAAEMKWYDDYLAAGGVDRDANPTPASSAAVSTAPADGEVSLSMSWWGGESRHEAYQKAIAAFMEEHGNITVNPTFSAWTRWEDTMSTKFAGGVAEDVCQVNWNWLYKYSANAQTFLDLNSVSDYIDFSQWDEGPMNACFVADAQQAVPVSMTGRIFYWNMTTFQKAGITEYPKTLEDLYAAAETVQAQLGDDYYLLYLTGYDRMILMVSYLESMYGKDWADPATSTLNYTREEVAEGMDFIRSLVDRHVVMPLPVYYGNNGSSSASQSSEWITGKIAGILEWDSAATKYRDALDTDNRDGFTVGDEIKFGDYNGGFTKVSMGLAITQTCQHPVGAAMLINFILNEEAGASIMGSECGIPASKAGLAYAEAAGAIDPLVEESNARVMDFCAFQLDPLFEDDTLKAEGTGVYQQVFDTMDYDNAPSSDLVELLLDGMQVAGYTV